MTDIGERSVFYDVDALPEGDSIRDQAAGQWPGVFVGESRILRHIGPPLHVPVRGLALPEAPARRRAVNKVIPVDVSEREVGHAFHDTDVVALSDHYSIEHCTGHSH